MASAPTAGIRVRPELALLLPTDDVAPGFPGHESPPPPTGTGRTAGTPPPTPPGDPGQRPETGHPETGRPGHDQHSRPPPQREAPAARPSAPPRSFGERPGHSADADGQRPGRPSTHSTHSTQDSDGGHDSSRPHRHEEQGPGERPRGTEGTAHRPGQSPSASGGRPAPRSSDQVIGKHDPRESGSRRPARPREEGAGRGDRVAAQPSGQVLPVLPLGAGMTLIGLGLAFLALRLRRG